MDEHNHPPEWDEFYRNIAVTRRRIKWTYVCVALSLVCSTITIIVNVWRHF